MFVRWLGLTVSLLLLYVSLVYFNPAAIVAGVVLTGYFITKVIFAPTEKDKNEGD